MAFPTAVQLTANLKLLIQKSLPNRVLPTITVTTTAAAIVGATSVVVTAVAAPTGFTIPLPTGAVLIQEGDTILFNSTVPSLCTVTTSVKAGDTSINVLPLINAVQSGNTATSNGFLRLLGAEDAGFKIGDKIIPTRAFEDGPFDSNVKVMLSAEISVKGFYRIGDPCIAQIIEPASLNLGEEVAWQLIYPNKQYRSGFALVQGFADDNKLDAIRGYSFTLKCNGPFQTGTLP